MDTTLMNNTQYLHSYWNNVIKQVDEAVELTEYDTYDDDWQTIEVALELDKEVPLTWWCSLYLQP